MRIHLALGAAAIALIPLTVMAQTTPPPADATAAVPATVVTKSWRDLILVEGLADAYGSVRFGGSATVPTAFRVFDAPTDTFNLAFAKLAIAIKPEPVGMRLDLGFGPVADITASNAPGGSEVFKHILQAYMSFAVSGGVPLTIDVGKFVTPAGAEVIESHANWNYSRSFLFGYAIPFTHTGIRLTAPVTSLLTLQVMLVNGWDLAIDNNAGKTLGVSATFAAPTGTTVILNILAGPEPQGMTNPWRLLVDLVASQTVGRFALSFNLDYGHQDVFNWFGVAAYARTAISDKLNLSLRGELFSDRQGFRLGVMGGKVTVGEVTATAGIPMASNAEIRLEARGDVAGRPIFAFEPGGMDLKKFQFTLTAAALVWF